MRQPAGGCFDGAGNLIVSDSKAKKIMCFGPKGDFLGNLEIFGNDGGGYLESLPSRMTDISINDNGYLIILTPLPLGGGRDRQDRGRSGCKKSILRCKINSPEENPSDPMSRTVNGVTTKMVGSIFEEVTDVEIKEDTRIIVAFFGKHDMGEHKLANDFAASQPQPRLLGCPLLFERQELDSDPVLRADAAQYCDAHANVMREVYADLERKEYLRSVSFTEFKR